MPGGIVQYVASELALVIVHIHEDLDRAGLVPRIFALREQVLAILVAANNQLGQHALGKVDCQSVEEDVEQRGLLLRQGRV